MEHLDELKRLLFSGDKNNIELAVQLAKGFEFDLKRFLHEEGFHELGIKTPYDIEWYSQHRIMDCKDKNVADLRCLRHFPVFTELNCSQNQITELTVLKDFHSLRRLDCRENKITSILPLFSLPNLRELICFWNPIPRAEIEIFKEKKRTCVVWFA